MRKLVILTCVALVSPVAASAADFETIYTFSGGADGAHPTYGLMDYYEGKIFGTTRGGDTKQRFGTVFELVPRKAPGTTWVKKTIWAFAGGKDGAYPVGKLSVLGNGGDIIGTTVGGDTADDFGTLFILRSPPKGERSWHEEIVHRFQGGSDSGHPSGELLYDVGTYTYFGTCYGNTQQGDYGSLWAWHSDTLDGKNWRELFWYDFNTRMTFSGRPAYPLGGLQHSGDDRLFGVTEGGGKSSAGCTVLEVQGCGTVYYLRYLDRGGPPVATVYQSPGGPDPSHMGYGGALLDGGFQLFAVSSGGNPNCEHAPSCGYLFTMNVQHSGGKPEIVHAFSGKDGAGAMSRPVYFSSYIYGSTDIGGTGPCLLNGKRVGCGVVYKVQNDGAWKFTILHDFQGGADGANPREILATDDGSIFGETENGGANGMGTVFRISNP